MPNDKITPATPSATPIVPPGAMTAPANVKTDGAGKTGKADKKIVNSTDATQGEALAVRAKVRKGELEALLTKTPAYDAAVRADIERALASVATLLTGDSKHLSPTTAAELDRWLEGSKHLGEMATTKPAH